MRLRRPSRRSRTSRSARPPRPKAARRRAGTWGDGGASAADRWLPAPSFPSPDRELHRLPHLLHGEYSPRVPGELIAWSAGVSFVTSLVGLFGLARRDA
jgi:hypothetical protein